MTASIVYGGLDVHKESIAAYLFCPQTGQFVEDALSNDREAVRRAVRRWQRLGELRLWYEASGAGFVLWRWLHALGVHCEVIAPSLIPKAPGQRVKTDRRDARQLALLGQAGLLTSIRVPDQEEEEARALVRLREDLTGNMVRAKNRVLTYLRTVGHVYQGGSTWTQRHRAWIAGLALRPVERRIVQTYLEELAALEGQRQEVDGEMRVLAASDRYREAVGRLCCLRGIDVYSAMVLVTELGDCRRFATAGAVMSYLGLVPREASSGERRWQGSITKMGNRHARWILGEAAWHQMGDPAHNRRLERHWRTQPAAVVAVAKQAGKRLHQTFWRIARRKERKTAVMAVARELAGFVWAVLTMPA